MNDFGIQIIVDSGLFVLIWHVQLIIYPSFHYIKKENFVQWHILYTVLMALIAGTFMLIQAGIEGLRLFLSEVRWWRIIPIVLIWLASLTLSIPCHRQLRKNGKELSTINRLVATNWIRTILWSLLFFRTTVGVYNLQTCLEEPRIHILGGIP